MMEPLLSERDTIVAPSSMALRAAYWATFPEPDMATRLPLKVSFPPDAYWIMWLTYCRDIQRRLQLGEKSYVDETVTRCLGPYQAAPKC